MEFLITLARTGYDNFRLFWQHNSNAVRVLSNWAFCGDSAYCGAAFEGLIEVCRDCEGLSAVIMLWTFHKGFYKGRLMLKHDDIIRC